MDGISTGITDLRFIELAGRISNDESDFVDIRSNGAVYVDKTELIYNLVVKKDSYFLARPRRFGKSTLLSAIKELFEHGIEPYDGHESYFKGLAIEKFWKEKGGKYKVWKLDFSTQFADLEASVEGFSYSFTRKVFDLAASLKIELPEDVKNKPFEALQKMLDAVKHRSLVLLIDECDGPFTRHLDNPEILEKMHLWMRSFYTVLKDNSSKFRLIFLTGITRYKDSAVFSMGNFITDLSLDPFYASICGYTKQELLHYFKEHLRYSCSIYFKKPESEVSDADIMQLLSQLTDWYDGFCFTENTNVRVFNNWSMQKFFLNRAAQFKPYWVLEGSFPILLAKFLHKDQLLTTLSSVAQDKIKVPYLDFMVPNPIENMNFCVLLFQTGFLSLNAPIETNKDIELAMPNIEMRTMLLSLLTSILLPNNRQSSLFSQHKKVLISAVQHNSVAEICNCISTVLQTVDYEQYGMDKESLVTAFTALLMYCCDFGVTVNEHQSTGRPDLCVDITQLQRSVIFEFKCSRDNDPAGLDKLLHEAEEQMKVKKYGETLYHYPNPLRIAMVFSVKDRTFVRAAQVKVN